MGEEEREGIWEGTAKTKDHLKGLYVNLLQLKLLKIYTYVKET